MFNHRSLEQFIGMPFFYNDEETGVGWEIEVFEIYRETMFDSTVIILTDNIRVKLSHVDMVRGPEQIFKKLYDGYKEAINNLEYTNG